MTRLAQLVFAALVLATGGAFFVAQKLKDEPSVVRRVLRTPIFSPNDDGRQDVARIAFAIKETDDIDVDVVDQEGNPVRRLITNRHLRGHHLIRMRWNGRDDDGRRVPDGLYDLRVRLHHEGRFQGHLAVALDETGREQAHALAREAAGRSWAALWCSPLERALETATIGGAAIGLEPRPDPRFAETDCGDWTDRPFAEVQAEDPEGFRRFKEADPTFAFPGGESFAQQGERVQAGLADVRAGALPALVVCHRGVMRLALAHARGDGLTAIDVPNASLLELPT